MPRQPRSHARGRQPNGLRQEDGGVGLPLLILLFIFILIGWGLSGTSSFHYLQAAARARERVAAELAQAGVEEAAARIEAGTLVPPAHWSRTESVGRLEGRIEVAVTAGANGAYRVRSSAAVPGPGRSDAMVTTTAEAEVVPPPEPFVLMAQDDVQVRIENLLQAGVLTIDGAIHAGGDVLLRSYTTALYTGLKVAGDVRAQDDVTLEASSTLLAGAETRVSGDVMAGGGVTLACSRGLLGTVNTVEVTGTIHYTDSLQEDGSGLLGVCRFITGGESTPGIVTPAFYLSGDPAYFEALVAQLEAEGNLYTLSPEAGACGTHTENVRVTGDLSCAELQVSEGVVVVVDGSLDVSRAEVQGLLYVRGGSPPTPDGHAQIDALSLLQILSPNYPVAGGGAVVATGNVEIGAGELIGLLIGGSSGGSLLQVLALAADDADFNNHIDFALGNLVLAAEVSEAPPLLLYTAAGGDITITDAGLAEVLTWNSLPLAAVAGGSITVDSTRLAGVGANFALEAERAIWEEAPPFLRGLGRAQVRNWHWE